MKYFVYILSNKNKTLFKVGITENLSELMKAENSVHRNVYTKQSGIDSLLYREECKDLHTAEKRRNELRKMSTSEKINFISEKSNINRF